MAGTQRRISYRPPADYEPSANSSLRAKPGASSGQQTSVII
jgi:hypothetical protein